MYSNNNIKKYLWRLLFGKLLLQLEKKNQHILYYIILYYEYINILLLYNEFRLRFQKITLWNFPLHGIIIVIIICHEYWCSSGITYGSAVVMLLLFKLTCFLSATITCVESQYRNIMIIYPDLGMNTSSNELEWKSWS
jgi:hypothetical protein